MPGATNCERGSPTATRKYDSADLVTPAVKSECAIEEPDSPELTLIFTRSLELAPHAKSGAEDPGTRMK
jgi:hypothetical protein